ncbi:TonB-dependent receptor [Steroidobacter sp.]|uniref:TonB-dependent receptor n=1 Tax=Steroidobacter sp. TaxID=1978227 RepID=UPI001A380BE6|nr:TonB-dependent siderophore receptor [Steroidobacter sp.]MBL8270965.1 TonB-dependent siderophore receptor [Steroidobacter sp.]
MARWAGSVGMLAVAVQVVAADRKPDETEAIIVEGRRERSTVVLDEPVLTGSRLGIDAFDLPASVSVISHELIQLRGARTAVEAIESAVGMTGGTSVGSIPNYATRGFAGNDITVMRDGIRQNTVSQSARPLDSFLFERIEVLKGPASLLYGEGAVGGAINYVSKLPNEVVTGELTASVSSWNTYRTGFGLGGPAGIDDLYYRVDVSHSQSDGYVDGSGYDYTAAAAALRYDATDNTTLTLQSSFLKDSVSSYYGTPLVYDAVIDQNGLQSVRKASSATDRLVNARIDGRTRRLNYNNLDNFSKADNSFTRFIVDSNLSERWSLRNETYVATQHLDWRNTESTVWNPATQLVERASFFLIYRNDLQVGNRLDLKWSGTLAGRPNTFLIGALYDDNEQIRNSGQTYASSPTPANVPLVGFNRGIGPAVSYQRTVKVTTDTVAAYVENVFEPIERVKLVGGLRYEQIDVERTSYVGAAAYEKSYDPVTGRLGVIFQATDDLNLYASYSRAAQPVSQLVSLTVSQDDFSLQKGTQYEVGAKASIRGTDLTFALFDIEKQDVLTSNIVDGVRINSQVGSQVSQGAEFAIAFNLPGEFRVDTHAAWTWKAEYEDFFENLGAGVISRSGNTPPNVPKFVAGLFFVKPLGDWEFTAGARHVGERQANNNNGIQLDAYTTFDASVGYRWDHAQIVLRGRNLSDEEYAEWASGGGLMVKLADPRSFELGVKYSF